MYDNIGLIPGTIAALVLGGMGQLILVYTGLPSVASRMFVTAFGVRFIFSVIIYQLGLVNVLKDEDASGWIAGVVIAQSWNEQNLGVTEIGDIIVRATMGKQNHSYTGYFNMLAVYFYLNNAPYRLVAAALNGFFGAMTVVMVYAFGRTMFTEWVGRRAGWWTCLIPSMVLWSAMTIKEPVVILLEMIALYACAHLRKGGFSLGPFAVVIACIFLLLLFRFYASYVVGLTVLLSLFLPNARDQGQKLGAAILGGLAALVLVSSGWQSHAENRLERMSLNQIESLRRYSSSAKAGFGSGVETDDIRSQKGMVIGLSVGAAHLLLAPFPWQLGGGSVRMLLTLPELLAWWWLFFCGVVPGTAYVLRKRLYDCLPLFVFLLAFGVLYSLTFGNVGMIFRQRAQLLPWLLVLGMVGLELRRQRREARGTIDLPVSPARPVHPANRHAGLTV
jgi:hypothetical protein